MRHAPRQPRQPRRHDEHQQQPKTSWNKVAGWYGSHLQEKDTFQETLVFPGALKLLVPQKGAKYLDIACGEGTFAKMIVEKGGAVVGLDAAPALVRRAQAKKLKNATFYIADASRFTDVLRDELFDGATCILAIQNIREMGKVFANAAKVLKKGASLVLVLNHPTFRIPRQSSWVWDEAKKMQFRRIDMYMSPAEIPIQMRPGDAPTIKTFSYHRPLQDYFMELAKAGFVVDALQEWTSDRESDSGPRAKAENRTRREIPLFMAIRAKKQ